MKTCVQVIQQSLAHCNSCHLSISFKPRILSHRQLRRSAVGTTGLSTGAEHDFCIQCANRHIGAQGWGGEIMNHDEFGAANVYNNRT